MKISTVDVVIVVVISLGSILGSVIGDSFYDEDTPKPTEAVVKSKVETPLVVPIVSLTSSQLAARASKAHVECNKRSWFPGEDLRRHELEDWVNSCKLEY